jgi:hypothetical protein
MEHLHWAANLKDIERVFGNIRTVEKKLGWVRSASSVLHLRQCHQLAIFQQGKKRMNHLSVICAHRSGVQ